MRPQASRADVWSPHAAPHAVGSPTGVILYVLYRTLVGRLRPGTLERRQKLIWDWEAHLGRPMHLAGTAALNLAQQQNSYQPFTVDQIEANPPRCVWQVAHDQRQPVRGATNSPHEADDASTSISGLAFAAVGSCRQRRQQVYVALRSSSSEHRRL